MVNGKQACAVLSYQMGQYIVTIDDDLQFNPEDIVKLYHHLINHDLLLVYGIPKKVQTRKYS